MKHRILSTILLVIFVSLNLIGQGKVAEKRKQKQMQSKNEMIFGDDDPDFQISEVPEKWKDESAVILCQKSHYKYYQYLGEAGVGQVETLRKRIKVNDNSAIEDYSVFFYRYSMSKEEFVGIKLIKADGSEVVIDMSEAVEIADNEVPKYFKQDYFFKYKKIAIPNLEKGDIIDYYSSVKSEYAASGTFSFTPLVFNLATKYPILKQKYEFDVSRSFKVSFRSYNGAKEISKVDTDEKIFGKRSIFVFEDSLRDKIKYEYWKYQYLDEPSIKFQVNFVPKSMLHRTSLLVTENDLINDKVKLKTIQTHIPIQTGLISEFDKAVKYIKKYHKDLKSETKKAEIAYYYLRYLFYDQTFNGYSKKYKDAYLYGEELPIVDHIFTNTFIKVLWSLKIHSKYVIAVNRMYGNFDDVLLRDELITGVKVKDTYFFSFSNFTTHGFIPYQLLGSEAIEFDANLANKYKDVSFKKVVLQENTPEQNKSVYEFDATINEEFNLINFNRQNTHVGYQKNYYSSIALWNVDYFKEDEKQYDPNYKGDEKKKGNKGRLAEEERMKKAEEKERNEEKYKFMKEFYSDDYEVKSYDNFELISDGRFANKAELIYKEQYTVENLINKAGQNYILNLGSFIGDQIKLEQEDLERTSNIYLNYPWSTSYIVKLKIPEGYKMEGLDQFNINIVNDLLEFSSSATIDGENILMQVDKKYMARTADKAEWPKYIEFLEEVYSFTQKKVVLKK
ncbi:MAG: DUF3857 domain-containing protein [Bacteroidales bacterium]|nr:DUF3857 domain-containing protein [Bacteroidales bacterium]MCF8454784.1 DUF3857 domain-containing protein [Bacteroidales bacterium]